MNKVHVELLVNTAYKGPKFKGDVFLVPSDTADRWVKNHIAKIVDEEHPASELEDESKVDLSGMNAKELYALCKEMGIEAEAKKSKEYYIEKLS